MKTNPAISLSLAALACVAISSCETTGDFGPNPDPRMRSATADHFGDGTIVGGWDEMPPVEEVFPHLYPEKTGKKTGK